jgi:phage shock protein E
MGLFDLLQGADINKGIEEWQETPNAVLVDVRTSKEYERGHIPGSINVPLDAIDRISSRVDDVDVPLYVHCQSGARSSQAVRQLKRMGYANVTDIGGIIGYRGKVER